jgi:TonB family protein
MQSFISNRWKIASVLIILLFLASGSLASEKDWDTPPQPVNGFKALQKELIYPDSARKNGIQGTVTLKVHVDDNGDIVDTKIVKSLEQGCDKAAVQALKAVEWKPALKDNKSIAVWFSIDIKFKLE